MMSLPERVISPPRLRLPRRRSEECCLFVIVKACVRGIHSSCENALRSVVLSCLAAVALRGSTSLKGKTGRLRRQ